MKVSEITGRCLKARIISWLNSGDFPAYIPTIDGSGVILALYRNGRHVQPEVVRVPNSPAELGNIWGPDGPVNMGSDEDKPDSDEPGENSE